MWPLAVAFVVVAGLAMAGQPRPGLAPGDTVPPGYQGPPTGPQRLVGRASTRPYDAFVWTPGPLGPSGSRYIVAKRVGITQSWIGFVDNSTPATRRFVRAHAESDAELAMMKSDFGLE